MDLLLVPYWADRDLDLIQWPPFLLASKVCSDRNTLEFNLLVILIFSIFGCRFQ